MTLQTNNKTRDRGLVKPSEGFATLAGHVLVIVNEADGGRQLRQLVLPGGKAKGLFFSRGGLAAYQVTLDEHLRTRFVTKQLHSDAIHAYSLEFSLSFRVLPEQPELIVLRFDDDPLLRVEDEVKRVLCPQVGALPWSLVEGENDLTRHVIGERSVDDSSELVQNAERLRAFARTWGIDLRRVEVARHLDEDDLQLAREREAAKRESLLRTTKIEKLYDQSREEVAKYEVECSIGAKRLEVERELGLKKAQYDAQVDLAKLPAAWARGTEEAIHDISRKPGSFYEINLQLQQAMQLADSVVPLGASYARSERGAAELGPGVSNTPRLTAASPSPRAARDSVRSTLEYACDVAAALPCDEKEQQRFLGAMLRVLASVLAESSDVEEAKQRLTELHGRYAQDMAEPHSQFVQSLGRRPRARGDEH